MRIKMKFLWTTTYVKNLDESIAFYSNLVGLQMLRRFPAGPGIEIAFMGNGINNETQVELLADSKKSTINYSDFISIGFAVDSVDAMLDSVKSKNIPVHDGPFETPGSKFFSIKDPNGLNVQFFQQKK
jgi:lactoylglutathione lyase